MDNKRKEETVEQIITRIYGATSEVSNMIQEMESVGSDFYKNNWSVGVDQLSTDLTFINHRVMEQGFSLDYPQAQTFLTFTNIFNFLIDRMIDRYIGFDEGYPTVKFVQTTLRTSFEPLAGKVCLRVKELDLIDTIPPAGRGLYNRYIEEAETLAKNEIGEMFSYIFDDETSSDEYDVYLDEATQEVRNIFDGGKDIGDFNNVREILENYVAEKSRKDTLDLDF